MITREEIISLAEEAIKGSDKFVVNVTVSKSNVIELFLDSDSSVTIDDCVSVSRFINERLDRDIEDYELNVSSAGIDEPLRLKRQYNKYIGEDLVITDNNGEKNTYRLAAVLEDSIEVELLEQKTCRKRTQDKYHEAKQLPFSDIKSARPYIKF
ncbi:MAG: ribosome assembly cofactor RimP [Candidatus Limimorpha sp.]